VDWSKGSTKDEEQSKGIVDQEGGRGKIRNEIA
jgi:hypothetical protein